MVSLFGAEWKGVQCTLLNPNKKGKPNILSLYLIVRGQTIEQTQSGLDL